MIFRAENIYILKQVLLAHFFLLRNFMLSQGYLRCSFKTHSDQSETSVLFYFFVFVFFEQVVKARKGSPRNNISCYIWYHVLSHMISCGFIIWFYRKYIYIYLKYCSVYIIYIYIYIYIYMQIVLGERDCHFLSLGLIVLRTSPFQILNFLDFWMFPDTWSGSSLYGPCWNFIREVPWPSAALCTSLFI